MASAIELRLKIVGVGLERRRPDDNRIMSNLGYSAHLALLLFRWRYLRHSLLDHLPHDLALIEAGQLRLGGQPHTSRRGQTDHDRVRVRIGLSPTNGTATWHP